MRHIKHLKDLNYAMLFRHHGQCYGAPWVQDLIERGADPNVTDEISGTTPLHEAAKLGYFNCIRELLNAGADPNREDYEFRKTPLHYAAQIAIFPTDCARELLNAGADPNSKDKYGMTPLHYAARNNDVECVQLLLAAGADPTAKTNDGMTPLEWARDFVKTRELKCGGLLLEAEEKWKMNAKDGEMPLGNVTSTNVSGTEHGHKR